MARLDTSTPEGIEQMAHAYRLGQGVPQDDLVARRWMTRAARAGDAGAMNDLGQMLEMGIGGSEDQAEAARWYAAAAEAGIAQARHSLALMLFEGRGMARDAARAERLLPLAARAGHAIAADLAFRIWAGEIAPQVSHEGCLWSLVAKRLGGANGGPETCRSHEAGLSADALSSVLQYRNGLRGRGVPIMFELSPIDSRGRPCRCNRSTVPNGVLQRRWPMCRP